MCLQNLQLKGVSLQTFILQFAKPIALTTHYSDLRENPLVIMHGARCIPNFKANFLFFLAFLWLGFLTRNYWSVR